MTKKGRNITHELVKCILPQAKPDEDETKIKEIVAEISKKREPHYRAVDQIVAILKENQFCGWERLLVLTDVEDAFPSERPEE